MTVLFSVELNSSNSNAPGLFDESEGGELIEFAFVLGFLDTCQPQKAVQMGHEEEVQYIPGRMGTFA